MPKQTDTPVRPVILRIEVPEDLRKGFWERPNNALHYWAFKNRPRAFINEKIIFTFGKKPVAQALVLKVEGPGNGEGEYKHWHKVYWHPSHFQKFKSVTAAQKTAGWIGPVYHGTTTAFDKLETGSSGMLYFTDDSNYADYFATERNSQPGQYVEDSRLYPAYIKLSKPFDARELNDIMNAEEVSEALKIDADKALWNSKTRQPFWRWVLMNPQVIKEALMAQGYDSIMQLEALSQGEASNINSFIVFNKSQVRSATAEKKPKGLLDLRNPTASKIAGKVFERKLYRGQREMQMGRGYSSDPGDFGRGIYWTSDIHRARAYGKVTEQVVHLDNPLYLTVEQAYDLEEKEYGDLLHGTTEERMERALNMTHDLLAKGYDGLVARDKDGKLEVVDYRPYRGTKTAAHPNAEDHAKMKAFRESMRFPLTIYRALNVSNPDQIDMDALGSCWSVNEDSAQPYHGGEDRYKNDPVVIRAEVREEEIDWEETFYQNMRYAWGEEEVFIKSGTAIRLTGVKHRGDWEAPTEQHVFAAERGKVADKVIDVGDGSVHITVMDIKTASVQFPTYEQCIDKSTDTNNEFMLDGWGSDVSQMYTDAVEFWKKQTFPLTVYRAIVIPHGQEVHYENFGTSWSLSPDAAKEVVSELHDPDDQFVQVKVFTGKVGAEGVDWLNTIRTWMTLPEEQEVRLKPGAQVKMKGKTVTADHTLDVGDGDEYWAGEGNAASGILPVCPQKGTVCLAMRSQHVMTPGVWGTIGGAVKEGMSPQQSAKAELQEETGYSGGMTLIPAFVFTDRGFSYHNSIGSTSTEFSLAPKPFSKQHVQELKAQLHPSQYYQLNPGWETESLNWVPYEEVLADMEEHPGDYHPGMHKLFHDSRDKIEKALGLDKQQPKQETEKNPALEKKGSHNPDCACELCRSIPQWKRPWLTGKCHEFALALSTMMPDAQFVAIGSVRFSHVGLRKGETYYDVRGAMTKEQFTTLFGSNDVQDVPRKRVMKDSYPSYIGHEDELIQIPEFKAALRTVKRVFSKGKQASNAHLIDAAGRQNFEALPDNALKQAIRSFQFDNQRHDYCGNCADDLRDHLTKSGLTGFHHHAHGHSFVSDGKTIVDVWPDMEPKIWTTGDPILKGSIYTPEGDQASCWCGEEEFKTAAEQGELFPNSVDAKFRQWFEGSKVVDKNGNPLPVYHGTRSSVDFDEFSVDGPPTDESNYEGQPTSSGSGADPTAYMGAHFAVEPQVASDFATPARGRWQSTRYEGETEMARVLKVYLRITNPKDFGNEHNLREFINMGKISGDALDIAMEADGIQSMEPEQEEAAAEWYKKYENDQAFRIEQNRYLFERAPGGEGYDDALLEAAQELASQARGRLETAGHDGIRYKNVVEGGTGWVAFAPNQIKSAWAQEFNPEKPQFTASKQAEQKPPFKMPTMPEIVGVLRKHPLIRLKHQPKRAFLVGSFSQSQQNEESDVDILLEISPVPGETAEQVETQYRRLLQKHFVQNNIRGKMDSAHPQWCGRRVDLYFTYDADTETRPKVQLLGGKSAAVEDIWVKKAAGFAFKSFKKLWHVGSMDVKDKGNDSLEGAGLSVSVHPEEWQEIARIGGDLWELTKAGNRFLNFHRISPQQRKVIVQWGIQNGYVLAFDLLVTVYAEEELDCDGVWWADNFDPANLSAPRGGVIFPSKLSSWTTAKTKQAAVNAPSIVHRGPQGFNVEFHNDENVRVGHLQIDVKGDTAIVKAIDVDEDYQRRGIATGLYEVARKELLKRGVKTLKGSLEGSGPVQLREKVFGVGKTKYYHGGDEVDTDQAVKIMDVDYGYTRAETRLAAFGKRFKD